MTTHDDDRGHDDVGDAEDVTLAASDDVVAQIRAQAAKLRAQRPDSTTAAGVPVWSADGEAMDDELYDDTGPATPPTASAPNSAPDVTAPTAPDRAAAPPVSSPQASPVMPPAASDPASTPAAGPTAAPAAGPTAAPTSASPAPTADSDAELAQTRRITAQPKPPAASPVAAAPAMPGGSLIEGKMPPTSETSFWNPDDVGGSDRVSLSARGRRAGGLPLAVWIALVIALIVIASVGIALAVATAGVPT